MSKNAVTDWSSTPASNTDIAGIDIAENCPPAGINDAIRQIMAQIATWALTLMTKAGGTFTGPFGRDAGLYLDVSGGDAYLSWDATDYEVYKRAGNQYERYIGGARRWALNSSGLTLDNSLTVAGATVFANDVGFTAEIVGGYPCITMAAGARFQFNRVSQRWVFITNNVAVASIDGSGNVRALGSFMPATAP